ncbi:MAG: hypothetical protein ACE5I1_17480 [bacterium]
MKKTTALIVLLFAFGCKKVPTPPDPPPKPICKIFGELTVGVVQDRSVPNTYEIIVNGEVVETIVIDQPGDAIIEFQFDDLNLKDGDEIDLVASGSRAAFKNLGLTLKTQLIEPR